MSPSRGDPTPPPPPADETILLATFDGTVEQANERARDLFEAPLVHLLDRHLYDLIPTLGENGPPSTSSGLPLDLFTPNPTLHEIKLPDGTRAPAHVHLEQVQGGHSARVIAKLTPAPPPATAPDADTPPTHQPAKQGHNGNGHLPRTLLELDRALEQLSHTLEQAPNEGPQEALHAQIQRTRQAIRQAHPHTPPGATQPPLHLVDPRPRIETIAYQHPSLAGSKPDLSLDPLPPIPADSKLLDALLHHLLTHIIEATPEHDPPRIHVASDQDDDRLHLAFITNAPHKIPTPPTQHPREGPIGLGDPSLETSKRLTRCMGGTLGVHPPDRSTLPLDDHHLQPGQGAMYLVTLPADPRQQDGAPEPP